MIKGRTDAEIKADILAELKWTPQIHETDIGVIVKNGAVRLTGTVPNYPQKSMANDAAKRIKGVHSLVNDIDVRFDYEKIGTNADIAERIARIFEWNAVLREEDLKAEVNNGTVTLSGKVDWNYEKDYAEKLIEGINGVKCIFNNITINNRVTAPGIKNEIVRALHRQAGLEAKNIEVSVNNNVVTLKGNANNYHDREIIKNAAWTATGVSKVIDNITVGDLFYEVA